MLRPLDGSQPLSHPSPRPAAPRPGPQDRYLPGTADREPDLRDAARLLDSRLQLDKAHRDYRKTAWCPAPDGTVYGGYSEAGGTRGYVASIRPDGAIRWELPFDEGAIREVTMLPDGRLAVATPKGVTVVGPDGRVQSREPAPAEVLDLEVDGSGARYVVEGPERRLEIRSADGSRLPVADPLAQARVAALDPLPDGGVLVRGEREAWRLGPGGRVTAGQPLPSWPPQGDTVHEVAGSWALPGGDLLLQKRSTTTEWPAFHHGMEHDPIFGLGGVRTPIITRQNALVRISPQGEERWSVADLGEKLEPAVLPDGTAFFASPKADRGRHAVDRVAPDGRRARAFEVSDPVEGLRAGQGNTLLVLQGDRLSRYTPSGTCREAVTVPEGYQFEGEGGAGRLVFSEAKERALWSWDPGTGAWTRLTDRVGDHSVAVALENVRDDVAPAPEIRQEEGRVAIGGIELPIRRG